MSSWCEAFVWFGYILNAAYGNARQKWAPRHCPRGKWNRVAVVKAIQSQRATSAIGLLKGWHVAQSSVFVFIYFIFLLPCLNKILFLFFIFFWVKKKNFANLRIGEESSRWLTDSVWGPLGPKNGWL